MQKYRCWLCLGTAFVPAWVGRLKDNGPLPDWVPAPSPCNTCTNGFITGVDLVRIALTSDNLVTFVCDSCEDRLVTDTPVSSITCPKCPMGRYRKSGVIGG